jgi:sugar phosphate isomerase/epimerase
LDIKDRLSFQLYSARKFPPLAQQLQTIASLGYRQVEPYGALLAEIDELEVGLKTHDLSAPSCHIGIDLLRQDLEGAAAKARRLGTELIVIPFLAPQLRPTDSAGWRAIGREVSEIRKRLHALGFRLAWHNHDFELIPLEDGSTPLDILLESDPELTWEADLAWIVRANSDPLDWVQKYRDRISAFHVKDVATPGTAADEDDWADVGSGTIDWKRLLPAMNGSSAGIFVVEHDNPSDFERFARQSRDAVRSW